MKTRLSLVTGLAFAAVTAIATGQDFPSRPIRLIVPSAPGGGTDILARHIAQRLTEQLKQTAVVENRPGAGSLAGTEYVAKAAPDGYTVMVGGVSNMVMNVALFKNLAYDPLRDFMPVSLVAGYPFVLVTRPDLPAKSLAEVVTYAKERPGKLALASAGIGALQHVWGVMLVKQLGLDMLHVPYKGSAPAYQDLFTSRVDMMFDNITTAHVHASAGKVKAYAVSSATRSPHLPNVPTVDETGLTKFVGESWMGLFVPAATPPVTVDILRRELAKLVADRDFAQRIERDGGRVMQIAAGDQQRFFAEELDRWTKQIRALGITAD